MIITVFNEKGGSGKSTTTLNIWGELTALGNKVVVIDTDSGGNAITHIADREHSPLKGLVYRASDHGIEYMESLLERIVREHSPDYLLIDTPPRIGEEWNSANLLADLFVIPGKTSLQDRGLTCKTAYMISRDRTQRPIFVIPTAVDKRQTMAQLAIGEYSNLQRANCLNSIRHSTVVEKAMEVGMPVVNYEPDAPVRGDYQKAVARILEVIAND